MPQQNPANRKDNKKSTPTSTIAPGSPLWNAKEHNQKSYGQGYDHNDPISLLKGTYSDGTAITRFGKFGFKKSFVVHGADHGTVFNLPIIREEGAQGTWEIIISQNHSKSTGVMGDYRSTTENGYDVCKVDLDLISMNIGKPGFSWSEADQELTLRFVDGEVEKVIEAIVPYRTSCRTLLPEILRQEITYRIQEFQSASAANYDGKKIKSTWPPSGTWGSSRCGGYYLYNLSSVMNSRYGQVTAQETRFNKIQTGIGTHSVYYNVYTLPMPRSWIENIVGNDVYLDKFDLNYTERVRKNTHRPQYMPNRKDDLSEADVPVQGIVARYDHTDKLEMVLGQTRFTTFALRSKRVGYNGRAGSDHRFAYGKIWVSNDKRISHRYSKYVNSSLWNSRILDTSTAAGVAGIQRIISRNQALITLFPTRVVPLMLTAGMEYDGGLATGSTANKWFWLQLIEEQSGPYELASVIDPEMYTIGQMPLPQTSFDYAKQTGDPYYGYFYDAQPAGIDYNTQTADKPTSNHHPTTNAHLFTPYQNIKSNTPQGGRYWDNNAMFTPRTFATEPYLLDIEHEHQSWYISTRYNITDVPVFSYNDAVFAGSTSAPNKYLTTYPSDKILHVGDPFTGVGDIAHVMFNHHGTKPADYYNNRPVHVMSYEDPSNILDDYNTPEITDDVITDKHSHGYESWQCRCGWCRCCWMQDNNYNYFGGQVSKYPYDQNYNGDWTDRWLATAHDPLSAGKLDLLDAPENSFDPDFPGHKWDGNQRDTSAGGGVNAVLGNGSPGHGEDGTSRYLYDCSDIVHPLSSYEVNDNNLKGHYLCCTDHIDTHITLSLGKKRDGDQFDLGEIAMKLLINKAADYNVRNHSSYDRRALPDHEIAVGPTFNMFQEWDATPTNASVTDRLFTSIGAHAASPVLFLGLTAAVIPGGSLTNPNADPEPLPANIVISPNTTLVDGTVPKNNTATYPYTFTNIGEQTGTLRISNTFTPEKGVYTNDGSGNFTGDKVFDWSRTIKGIYRLGPSGFANTVSLSAGESVDVDIKLTSTTDNPAGYVVSLNYTIDAPGKLVSNKQIRFDIDV